MLPRRLPRWIKTKTENSTRTNYARNLAEADPDDPVEENGRIPAGATPTPAPISAVPAATGPRVTGRGDPAKATSRAPSAAMPKKIPFNMGGFRAALFLCLQPFPIASVC